MRMADPLFALATSARIRLTVLGILFLLMSTTPFSKAQNPGQVPPPPPPEPEKPVADPNGYKIQRDVNLVILHVSVVDEHGQFVPGLLQSNFRVFEDKAEQKISVLRQEDAPVSMGILVDNSGSMTDRRPAVNAAALTFVQTSNPDDEVFVAHFNEKYFFDLNKAFTNDLPELRKALQQPDTGSTTAMFDAVIDSVGHLKSGYRDKKSAAGNQRRRR